MDSGRFWRHYQHGKIFVIAPDKPSGDDFNLALHQRGMQTEIFYYSVAPRVIGDQINPDPQVERDLAGAIQKGFDAGYHFMVIACNTLQLWLPKAIVLLPEKVQEDVRIFTTFTALKQKFPNHQNRPVWLGTTVICREMPENNFQTLLSMNLPELQNNVQEIIWRVKGVTGADIRTASGIIKEIQNPKILKETVSLFLRKVRDRSLKQAIMGCTELPIAFREFCTEEEKSSLTLIDPAEVLADILPSRIPESRQILQKIIANEGD